jgi:hypothetical protein
MGQNQDQDPSILGSYAVSTGKQLLMLPTLHSSKTLVITNQLTQCNIPHDMSLYQQHSCENLKSYGERGCWIPTAENNIRKLVPPPSHIPSLVAKCS